MYSGVRPEVMARSQVEGSWSPIMMSKLSVSSPVKYRSMTLMSKALGQDCCQLTCTPGAGSRATHGVDRSFSRPGHLSSKGIGTTLAKVSRG